MLEMAIVCVLLRVKRKTTLQHTATHCNTLQTLQHPATHCNTLQHDSACCCSVSLLQHKRLRVMLGAAGVEFGYGTINLLRDSDVLKSEFLRDVRKALDHEAESSSGNDFGESDGSDD